MGEEDWRGWTHLVAGDFFSVPVILPVRAAWFRAPLLRTVFSREELPPLTLLQILVTVFKSSDILE